MAAANLNFDFCLVKYEAPKEYQQLGKLLSNKRKNDAETGKSHITARRLAALFSGVCPDTPKLVAAYGKRVSEISRLATDKASKDYSSSIFGAYTGVDATSIWAAATSSEDPKGGAIHVHLLACILTIWEPGEAISIWVELVEERKRAIANDFENGAQIPFALAAAAQQEITRAELADWDRSARAWIETANNMMLKRHTQLKLILKNISLPIGKVEIVYPSVIEAWRNALTVMERLLSGIPQEVNDGTALLGLSYWHLYPDILVFGSEPVEVHLEDDIVPPGGILSLGCSSSATSSANGISWSLSLAHMRYYGRPIRKEALIQEDPSRLTPSEFSQVVLGCLMGSWNIDKKKEVATLMCLRDLGSYGLANKTSGRPCYDDFAFRFLQDTSLKLLANQETANQLIALGRKRTNFLPTTVKGPQIERNIGPFFGLSNPSTFLEHLGSNEGRIEYLRRIGGRLDEIESLSPIIRYQVVSETKSTMPQYEFATMFPINYQNLQRSSIGVSTRRKHMRWISAVKPLQTIVGSLRTTQGEIVVKNKIFHSNTPLKFSRIIPGGGETTYIYRGGSSEVAVFWPDNDTLCNLLVSKFFEVDAEDIQWAVAYSLIERSKLYEEPMFKALAMISWGLRAFRTLTERMIRAETLLSPLNSRSWARELASYEQHGSARPTEISTFLTIAHHISIISDLAGGCDIPETAIPPNCMGISVGDSLYVPNRLLDDPIEVSKPQHLKRVLGNIGQPGFTLLSSVASPITSPIDHSRWRVATTQIFDGKPEDALRTTSMHLSFTSWKLAINQQGAQGNRDNQYKMMEAIVSIRDKGNWIGDVDIISALKNHRVYQLPPQGSCHHTPGSAPSTSMVSIGSWDNLCDPPSGHIVVRAHGNWLARLAAVSFLAQQAEDKYCVNRITVCPKDVCWLCVESEFANNVYVY